MTKEKFNSLLDNYYPYSSSWEASRAAVEHFRNELVMNRCFDSLYPPSIEALKAEPWKWLIADPRDPRANELIGKKVFYSGIIDFTLSIKTIGILLKIDTSAYASYPFYHESLGDFWSSPFIWPAPIDMQEGETK